MTVVRFIAAAAVLLAVASCVHEMPDYLTVEREVTLNVHHSHGWSEALEVQHSRAAGSPSPRYHMVLTPAGKASVAAEFVHYTADPLRADFSHRLSLLPGEYDLYVWHDWADDISKKSLYFDTSDFSKIGYSEPYSVHPDLRDALRGKASFTVEGRIDSDYSVDVDLALERPMAKYRFISTDLDKFVAAETTRAELTRRQQGTKSDEPAKAPELSSYSVRVAYTGYMPHKFNNFLNRPVDSTTGVTYTSSLTPLSDSEAELCLDHVMVNGAESSVRVALEVVDRDGNVVATTPGFDVPTKRNRETVVRGSFLTSKATGGIGINPDFEGEFNIEIK